MDLLVNPQVVAVAAAGAPPLVAHYRPVMWEPVAGTGERIVALVAVQAHENAAQSIAPATYPIISRPRLRQLLGKQRGPSSANILDVSAEYMTQRQQAGLPLEDLKPLFHGFEMGPVMLANGWSVEQLLDAAVRSVSAFGTAEQMVEEEEVRQPRHTVRTGEFLTQLRRIFTGHNKDFASRFDVPLRIATPRKPMPDVVVDYAHGPLVVQVTSLPSTARQAELTERETQAKLFQLDMARRQMEGNKFTPTLLVNSDAMGEQAGSEARKHAERTLERVLQYAKFEEVEVMEAANPSVAARLLDANYAAY